MKTESKSTSNLLFLLIIYSNIQGNRYSYSDITFETGEVHDFQHFLMSPCS